MSVFNGEKYLKDSINSVLNQSRSDFEFIIVNDGSNDSTSQILNQFKKIDKRIILIERGNKGLIYSLNEGLHLARGKYILRQDADDLSCKDRIKKQCYFMENHSDISIAFCWHYVLNGNSKIISKVEYSANLKKIKNNILKKRVIYAHGSVMFIKDDIIKLGGYNSYAKHFEDYDLWLRAVNNHYKISAVDELLYSWRICHNSISMVNFKEMNPEKSYVKLPYYNHLQNLYFRVKDSKNINKNTRVLYNINDLSIKAFAKCIVCNLPFNYTKYFKYL